MHYFYPLDFNVNNWSVSVALSDWLVHFLEWIGLSVAAVVVGGGGGNGTPTLSFLFFARLGFLPAAAAVEEDALAVVGLVLRWDL